jgi:hypothetical protein
MELEAYDPDSMGMMGDDELMSLVEETEGKVKELASFSLLERIAKLEQRLLNLPVVGAAPTTGAADTKKQRPRRIHGLTAGTYPLDKQYAMHVGTVQVLARKEGASTNTGFSYEGISFSRAPSVDAFGCSAVGSKTVTFDMRASLGMPLMRAVSHLVSMLRQRDERYLCSSLAMQRGLLTAENSGEMQELDFSIPRHQEVPRLRCFLGDRVHFGTRTISLQANDGNGPADFDVLSLSRASQVAPPQDSPHSEFSFNMPLRLAQPLLAALEQAFE